MLKSMRVSSAHPHVDREELIKAAARVGQVEDTIN
jgi:hypothetical protein